MPAYNPADFNDIKNALVAELVAKDGLTPVQAETAAADYGRFLALVNDETPTCPPSLADTAWHRHMEMATYEADVVKLCGRVLNHDKNAFGTDEFAAAWADTRARWAATHGIELDADPTKADVAVNSPAMCIEQPGPTSRVSPAMCIEQPGPTSRVSPAMCIEQPGPTSRVSPAMCIEQPGPTSRVSPAMCIEQPRKQ